MAKKGYRSPKLHEMMIVVFLIAAISFLMLMSIVTRKKVLRAKPLKRVRALKAGDEVEVNEKRMRVQTVDVENGKHVIRLDGYVLTCEKNGRVEFFRDEGKLKKVGVFKWRINTKHGRIKITV